MQEERQRTQRAARHAATLIGVTALAEYGVNIALIPLIHRLAFVRTESLAGQTCNAALYLIVFFFPFFVLSRIHGWTLRDLNGNGRPSASVFVMAICLAAGWNLIATYLGAGIGQVMQGFGVQETVSAYTVPDSTAALLMQIVQVAILPPLAEEMCYRGFFLKLGREAMGIWPAILLSSLAFWMAHDSVTILPLAFGFGVLGGVLRVRYQSLLPSMCGHFVVNGTYLLVNYVQATASQGVQLGVLGVFFLWEIAALIVGIVLAVRCGLFSAAARYIRMARDGKRAMRWRGVFTSIPFWLMVASAVYLTARNMEVLG